MKTLAEKNPQDIHETHLWSGEIKTTTFWQGYDTVHGKETTVSSQFILMQLCFGPVTKHVPQNKIKKKTLWEKMCLSSFTQCHAV